MKPALLSRFVRSSRHVDAEPCRNCGTVYFGNFCNECGQEAYTGAPTTLGFIYEFLTRNLFERGKVHRTLWQLVRHPGGLTVDFLEGRRQRFIRPVRLYFILSVMYFLLLSYQNSTMRTYFEGPAPAASASAPISIGGTPPKALLGNTKPKLVLGPIQINQDIKVNADDDAARRQPMFADFPYDKQWEKYPAWGEFKQRMQAFNELSIDKRKDVITKIALDQAPKAMFFLVPVFALFLKALFVFRRIPYGAHLLFAFHYHCYVFLMLLLMQLPVHELFKVIAGFSMPWYLLMSLRTTYQVGWWGALLRLVMLAILYFIAIVVTFVAAMLIGILLQSGAAA